MTLYCPAKLHTADVFAALSAMLLIALAYDGYDVERKESELIYGNCVFITIQPSTAITLIEASSRLAHTALRWINYLRIIRNEIRKWFYGRLPQLAIDRMVELKMVHE